MEATSRDNLEDNGTTGLTEEHWEVLRRLENREEQLINFGIYETYVGIDELVNAEDGSEAIQRERVRVRELLTDLEERYRVLALGNDQYRSRISEIVRLLAHVKQRFGENDAQSAPYLIRSLRVRFEDRRRQNRETPLEEVVDRLVRRFLNRESRRDLDRARNALQLGVGTAIGGGDPHNMEIAQAPDIRLTRVQENSMGEIGESYLGQEGGGFVVTGNTGSGKTEAAIWPLLLGATEERLQGTHGCKVILAYPRKELAKNQLQRICRYAAHMNRSLEGMRAGGSQLSVGIVFGETPHAEEEIEEGKFYNGNLIRGRWNELGDGYELPYFRNASDEPVEFRQTARGGEIRSVPEGWEDRGWVLSQFRATRTQIRNSPPDILIITTEMLHRWLMDPDYSEFFGVGHRFCAPRAIVLDEIHLYDTTHGAQIGMLVRRLRHRLRMAMQDDEHDDWTEPICIGMSATIGHPSRFWEELSGIRESEIIELSPQEEDLEQQTGREHLLFIQPEIYSRGRRVGSASVAIQSIMCIAHNMARRSARGGDPPKHRTLVFQDSISKLKKLTLEFYDAEFNRFLPQHRMDAPAEEDPLDTATFRDGEYWYFDVEDSHQYSENRRNEGDPPAPLTTAPTPVYSGHRGIDNLNRDIIFATGVLEVGYDDASIQAVFQHHAPRTTASFVQKKGRAGRSNDDRPITAVTLSRYSYRDAFYFQNPDRLYRAENYNPPLNVENYFVQRFHTLALLFDELARLTYQSGTDYTQVEGNDLDGHMDRVSDQLEQFSEEIARAFATVTAGSFRRALDNGSWQDVWNEFVEEYNDPELRSWFDNSGSQGLLHVNPKYPNNLFGTINMPTLRVGAHPYGAGEMEWEDLDIGLSFFELAPGKVTRRFGRGQWVHWRPPMAKLEAEHLDARFSDPGDASIERFKPNRSQGPGPFDPDRIQNLEDIWGPDWENVLPNDVHQLYGDELPDRFYRPRYVEAWTIGELDEDNPRGVQQAINTHGKRWWAWGALDHNTNTILDFHLSRDGQRPDDYWAPAGYEWRPVSPDSNSHPLHFSYARPIQVEQEETDADSPAKEEVVLPPLYGGLIDALQFYFGEADGHRSAIDVWEAHYGAEATIRLMPDQRGSDDPHAGQGDLQVRYVSEHDGEPILYGYHLQTEGVRIPFHKDRLEDLAESVFQDIWDEDSARLHLQDQYLRFLLKSESWSELNSFEQRRAADLIATMRAVTRDHIQNVQDFLDELFDEDSHSDLIDEAEPFWQESGVLTQEFIQSFSQTLADPDSQRNLRDIFGRIRERADVMNYIQSTILHSLKHGIRNLFITEGSTNDEEVGSHGTFPLTYGHWSDDESLWIYERNQDGSGSTRLVHEVLASEGMKYVLNRLWDTTLSCPVGDEEAFMKGVIRRYGDTLRTFAEEFRNGNAEASTPKDFLQTLLEAHLQDSPHVQGLARLLVATDRIYGTDEGIPRIDLVCEIQEIEDELANRFQRPPTVHEVANFALHATEANPGAYPRLDEMLQIYLDHHEDLTREGEGPDEASSPGDRFISQVRSLSLSTCDGSCEACLGSRCDQGSIHITQHALSRDILRRTHRILCNPFTLEYDANTDVTNLTDVADANQGWVLLRHSGQLPQDFTRSIREAGLEPYANITILESLEAMTIYRQAE